MRDIPQDFLSAACAGAMGSPKCAADASARPPRRLTDADARKRPL
jgi:hypothetical protein